jgi:hypothetical protein
MLPDFRFVFGALITLALMGMVAVGLFVSARLSLQAKMGPLEASRTSVFTDSVEWNQFYDAGSVRRFVGLARQGEARETADTPPEHRTEALSVGPPAIPAAPADPPAPERLAAPDPATAPPAVADAMDDAPMPADGATTIAAPALPEQIRESPVPERTAVQSAVAAPDVKPGPDETVVAHAQSIPLPGAPSLAEEPTPTTIPFAEPRQDRAGAVTIETENGWDQEPWDTTSVADDGNETSARGTDERVATTPAPAPTPVPAPTSAEASLSLPSRQPPRKPSQARTTPPPAALAKAAVPPARSPTPTKRAQPAEDDKPERPYAVSPPRDRTLASRPRLAPQGYVPQSNALPQAPPGQPVFGPYFPYATPQPGAPQFGPHFGQQPPAQPRREAAPRVRAPQYPAQPAFDPRQIAPQPRTPAPPQANYGPAYGWR